MNTIDQAVRVVLSGIDALDHGLGTRHQLSQAFEFSDAGRLSSGEAALLDIAQDLWNGNGRNSFVSNVSRLGKDNRELVHAALAIYFNAVAA